MLNVIKLGYLLLLGYCIYIFYICIDKMYIIYKHYNYNL